jgi:non-ribosomal peptide synthetase component E (peptide arylation enzyme)
LLVKVTPLGNAPVSVIDGVGLPVAVTVKLPTVPTVKAVLLALVIAGAVPVPPLPAARKATICITHSPSEGAGAL